MPDPAPDRALRRLVVRLAAATREDIEAVLAELDPGRRRAVEALLAQQAGDAPGEAARPSQRAPLALLGLSQGLSDRLAQAVSHEGPLTQATAVALRETAQEMLSLGLALPPPPPPERLPAPAWVRAARALRGAL